MFTFLKHFPARLVAMGMYIDENGKLNWRADGEESVVSKAAKTVVGAVGSDTVKEIVSTATKVGGISVVAGASASFIGGGAIPIFTAAGGGAAAGILLDEMERQKHDADQIALEDPTKPTNAPMVDYQMLIQQMDLQQLQGEVASAQNHSSDEHITPGSFGQKQSRGFGGRDV